MVPMRMLSQNIDEIRWQKVLAYDKAADGTFVYAVRTTGIYCRPSCPSRRAKRENVIFYQKSEDAEQAGFRPCRRCMPELGAKLVELNRQRHSDLVIHACRLIDMAEETPSIEEIAKNLKTGAAHLHRIFKEITGLTPKEYTDAKRSEKLRAALAEGSTSITQAIYDSGFGSSSRFYEASDEILGMKPKNYRSGGMSETIRFAIGETSLGTVLVAQSDKGICAILMGDDPELLIQDLEFRFPKAELVGADRDFENHVAKVIGLIENPQSKFDLPLDLRGTVFQARVWQALREIPFGETITYSELAKRIGSPKSVRAVASACGANKLAVAIPCHRVVRSDGSLSGYRWGVERKKNLLEKEKKAEISPLK